MPDDDVITELRERFDREERERQALLEELRRSRQPPTQTEARSDAMGRIRSGLEDGEQRSAAAAKKGKSRREQRAARQKEGR